MIWQIGALLLSIHQAFINYVLCVQHINLKHVVVLMEIATQLGRQDTHTKTFRQEEAGIRKDKVWCVPAYHTVWYTHVLANLVCFWYSLHWFQVLSDPNLQLNEEKSFIPITSKAQCSITRCSENLRGHYAIYPYYARMEHSPALWPQFYVVFTLALA